MRLFFITILSTVSFFAQDQVTYREYPKVDWSDFHARPPISNFSASISTGLSYSWSLATGPNGVQFDYQIEANLHRDSSWSKYTSGKPQVLKHEQLHYDITELFARKLRKAFSEYKVTKNVKRDIERIYKRIESERNQMQIKYDKETNHSLITSKQKEWEFYVANELIEYIEYYK